VTATHTGYQIAYEIANSFRDPSKCTYVNNQRVVKLRETEEFAHSGIRDVFENYSAARRASVGRAAGGGEAVQRLRGSSADFVYGKVNAKGKSSVQTRKPFTRVYTAV